MEKKLDLVRGRHLQAVFDDDLPCQLVEGDPPSMQYGVGEAHIAVVPTLEDIAFIRGPPQAATGARFLEPHEFAAGLRLVHPINPHGIVGGSAAEVLTPRTLCVKRVCPRINEKFLPPDRQGEREGVSMAMGGDGLITQGAGVCNQPDFILSLEVTAEDVVAAVRESTPDRQLDPAAIALLERGIGTFPEEPACLVIQGSRLRLEVAAAKQDRAGGEQRPVTAELTPLAEPYDETVVRIAEHGDVATRIHDRREILDHRLDARLQRRREFFPVRPPGEQREQKQIELELLV